MTFGVMALRWFSCFMYAEVYNSRSKYEEMNGKKIDTNPDIMPGDSDTYFKLNNESDTLPYVDNASAR